MRLVIEHDEGFEFNVTVETDEEQSEPNTCYPFEAMMTCGNFIDSMLQDELNQDESDDQTDE